MPTSVIQEIAHDFIDTSGDANTQSPQEQLIKAAKLGKQGEYCRRVKLPRDSIVYRSFAFQNKLCSSKSSRMQRFQAFS